MWKSVAIILQLIGVGCHTAVVAKVMACVRCWAIHDSFCRACLLTLASGVSSYMAKRACDDVLSKRMEYSTVLPFHSPRPGISTLGSTSTKYRPDKRFNRNTMPQKGAAYNSRPEVKRGGNVTKKDRNDTLKPSLRQQRRGGDPNMKQSKNVSRDRPKK